MADPKNYTWEPPEGNHTKDDAKNCFLIAIQTIAPEVLEYLYKEVFPHSDDCLQLDKELNNWVEKYKLFSENDWVKKTAINSMEEWSKYGVEELRGEWATGPHSSDVEGWQQPLDPLIIKLAPLDDMQLTRSEIRAVYQQQCNKQIENYLDQLEAHRQSLGWKKKYLHTAIIENLYTDDKEHRKVMRQEHYNWLVYFQVKGLSHAKIAEKARYTRRNIGKHISKATELCGIILREDNSPIKNK